MGTAATAEAGQLENQGRRDNFVVFATNFYLADNSFNNEFLQL